MNLAYPWSIASNGLTATESDDAHIRSMIEQLLLTNAGERVNRPGFGSGLNQLVFAPNSLELAATLQLTLQAAVARYLADLIDVAGLTVNALDERLMVEVSYRVRGTAAVNVAVIDLPVAGS
jgi:phage baseplate assembly protein W